MSSVPRVAHLVISLACGGLERLVVDWTNARNRRYPESTCVVCLDAFGDLSSQVNGNAVRCLDARRHRFPFDGRAVRRLRASVDTRTGSAPPALIHSHNLAARQYAALACFGTGPGHVHTEHGSNPHVGGTRNRIRNVLLNRLTDRVTVVSEHTAGAVVCEQGTSRDRLRVIPNGVAPHLHHGPEELTELRRQLRIRDDEFIVGSVGRLDHIKGYDRLLNAFASVAGPDNTLVLVGDGPERGALESMAEDLGVSGSVVFTGYRDDPGKYIELMDLFVLPSRSEGLSIALLEAMAARCPVAVTDVGENRRVIDDGKAGFLLPDDEVQWEEFLKSFEHPTSKLGGEMEVMLDRAVDRVAERYSLASTLDAYEEVYREVVNA